MNKYVIDRTKAWKLSLIVLGVFLGIFLFYRSFRYIAPFVIALVLSMFLEPLVKLFVKKTKMPRKLASVICIVLVLLLISLIVVYLITKITIEVKDLVDILPGLLNDWYLSIVDFLNNSNPLIELPQEVMNFVVDQLATIVSSLANFANSSVKYIINTAVSLPKALIFLVITVFATYFFLGEKDKFKQLLLRQFPEDWYGQISFVKNDVLRQILRLLRGYIMIIGVTFTELLIGFTIIGVDYAVVLALAIAIFDIFPVLGTGGILIPWAIISMFSGDISLGISLIILYLVVLVVRQVVEPKIVGAQIGVHPLLTLGAMYIGLELVGAVGLILGPVTLLILKSVFEAIFKGKNLKELLFVRVE